MFLCINLVTHLVPANIINMKGNRYFCS